MSSPAPIAEATRRAGVLWLSSHGSVPLIVWHLWHDGAAYVVGGGDEQPLPPLGSTATITVGGPDGALTWDAAVEQVAPGSARWDEVSPLLAAERLNAVSLDGLTQQWAKASTVIRLTPVASDERLGTTKAAGSLGKARPRRSVVPDDGSGPGGVPAG